MKERKYTQGEINGGCEMILKGRAPVERETSIQYSIIIIISTYLHLYCMRSGMNGGRAGGIRTRGSSANERVGEQERSSAAAAATILCSIPLYCCNSSAIRAAGFQKLFHTIEKRPPPCSVIVSVRTGLKLAAPLVKRAGRQSGQTCWLLPAVDNFVASTTPQAI
jgi:hypothetical protein